VVLSTREQDKSDRKSDLSLQRIMTKLFLVASIALISLLLVGVLHGGYLFQLSNAVTAPVAAPTATGSAASLFRPQSLPEPNPKSGTLRAYASKIGLYFGSMEDSQSGNGWETDWVRNTLSSEFNLLEPGNQLKWWITEPTQGTFDFGPADAFVEFAIAHKMKVRGHNLLWGMGNPNWLGNEGARTYTRFSGQQLQEILVNHIRTVMTHYRDKFPGVVKWWDVTNELMGWNNKFNSDGILWTKIGSNRDRADYVRVAFETARATDSSAILCMNDWGNEGSIPDRTENMITAVRTFRAEGVPIDCVGMEAHLGSEALRLNKNQILQVMKSYAEMGVQVQITEFDVQLPRSDESDWTKASVIASNLLQACVESPSCTAFNNWGFSRAFYFNGPNGQNTVNMLPWDRNNQPSPEYAAMRDVLEHAAP
jgi:endo-1,4-beta-xylanase